MRWNELTDERQLEAIDEASKQGPVLLFKHSTRCSISSAALHRLERAWTVDDDEAHTCWFLDLIRHRDLSDAIAHRYGVQHESPQAIVVRDGRSVWHASHFGITYDVVTGALSPVA